MRTALRLESILFRRNYFRRSYSNYLTPAAYWFARSTGA